ncbi:phosphoribosylglycinamide formyltransferase [Paenibacillus eucommiae]|uniref:Phosphoribosylglycinamide formyltransferase n=1 Tax=Paenibacillus eucommiae TaxID=1355755 RepID=A0ABS4J7K4_9BACL|nr:phosphoribosylglycinamide formyltransferase [Paenibacillus eucommiae]MBP1995790.1 phosphoribosylglycinamide formyltransferase-1 [Paenibacillus eucommiae]
MQPYRIAVFASGSGSNFQAIVDCVQSKELDVSIELLVCDRPDALVVGRAIQANVPVFTFRPKEYASREAYEALILKELSDRKVDLIVMAGYMRIITNVLVEPFYGRMINIHPSLLPSFPGTKAITQAYEYGVKLTGVTVHFVDGGLDSGPIVAQRSIEIGEGESEAALTQRIHAIEHGLLPQVIDWLRAGRVSLEGRRVTVKEVE